MAILSAQHVSKSFLQGGREIHAVREVSLDFMPGEFAVLLGKSGSGKSTLLSLLAGLDRPTSGAIYLEEQRIDQLSENALAEIRRNQIAFIFQSFHLLPTLTALENVALPLELRKEKGAEQKALALLERVGLAQRQDNFAHQLSGGEQQRVAIARALIAEPKILFADEPTGSLDTENGQAVFELLTTLRREQGATLILVTHDSELAAKAERIITLHDGQVASDHRKR